MSSKVITAVLAVALSALAIPAFADDENGSTEQSEPTVQQSDTDTAQATEQTNDSSTEEAPAQSSDGS